MQSILHSLRNVFAGLLLLSVLLAPIFSCSLYRNDRMWIPDKKYEVARKTYDNTNSLALTEQALRESHEWQRAEINEAIYRLKKQYLLE